MLWMFLAAAVTGMTIGLCFRVPMLLVCGLVLASTGAAASMARGATFVATVLEQGGLLLVLSFAYLCGLWVAQFFYERYDRGRLRKDR